MDSQSAALGEGWSDFFALLLLLKPGQTRLTPIPLGVYVSGLATGVRKYAYSTNFTVNPRKYSDLNEIDTDDVHTTGEVWAIMLYEVLWNLIVTFSRLCITFYLRIDMDLPEI